MLWSCLVVSSCSFHSCSLFPVISPVILPVASSAVVLWGRVSVLTLWSSMTCTRTERWHLPAPGWLMVFFLLFCPVSFLVVGEDCGRVLWQRSENIRRLPDVGYLHLLLIASSKPNRRAGGFRRIPPAIRTPGSCRKWWELALRFHHRAGREGGRSHFELWILKAI